MEDSHPSDNKGVLRKAFRGLAKMFSSEADRQERAEEELKQMVTESHEKGVLEADEAKMINNIFEFSDKEVSDIMTHRSHVVGVDVTMKALDAAKMMLSQSYSRFPVYEEDIDNIVGILHVKDVLRVIVELGNDFEIRSIMRKPYFVPDTQNIDILFREMQKSKMHMAIVIDEYGQTAGIVAMEDIIEEIVGNIFDEYDQEEKYIVKKDQDTYVMKGMAPLDEVEEALGVSFEEEDFDTLNGLIISKLEHIPEEDEQAGTDIAGYEFTVVSVENNMIQEVFVKKLPEEIVNEHGQEDEKES